MREGDYAYVSFPWICCVAALDEGAMTNPGPLPPAEHHAAEARARLNQKGMSSAAVTKRATTFFSPAFSKATVSLSPSISVTAP